MTFNEEQDKFTRKPIIKVFGVGGCGNKTIDRMIAYDVKGVEYYAVNTDVQDLRMSHADVRIQIGGKLTGGLGAGTDPNVGYNAALESEAGLREAIEGADMVYVMAGMGGGTGTGAAPVLARIAKELGILTVGVCTKPFEHEGKSCMDNAIKGLTEMRRYVDTLVIIPNQKLIDISDVHTTFLDAMREADDVLRQAVQGISEIINLPQTENIDFADVKKVMTDKGTALMGIGVSKGPNRAVEAARAAATSRLLEVTLEGATDCIVNISCSENLGMLEVRSAINEIRNHCDKNLNVIQGVTMSRELGDELVVTLVATGYALKAKELGIQDLEGEIIRNTGNDPIDIKNLVPTVESIIPSEDEKDEDIDSSVEKKRGFHLFGHKKDKEEKSKKDETQEKTSSKFSIPEDWD